MEQTRVAAANVPVSVSWEEKRWTKRAAFKQDVQVYRSQYRHGAGTVTDLSMQGCKLSNTSALVGEMLSVKIGGLRPLGAEVVWRAGNTVGCKFLQPLHIAVFEHLVRGN